MSRDRRTRLRNWREHVLKNFILLRVDCNILTKSTRLLDKKGEVIRTAPDLNRTVPVQTRSEHIQLETTLIISMIGALYIAKRQQTSSMCVSN